MMSGAKSPEVQVQEALWCATAAGFPHGGIYWLDIELDPYNPWPDCQTSSDYILEMIGELFKYGPTVGIYTSAYEWNRVTCQTVESEIGRARTENFTARLHEIALKSSRVREANHRHIHQESQDRIAEQIATNETFRSAYCRVGQHNDPLVVRPLRWCSELL
jgi:hypothetical protein